MTRQTVALNGIAKRGLMSFALTQTIWMRCFLKFGIDLYAVQDKCGIWLKPKRDVISIMGYVGTLELTQTLISQLPQNVNYPKQKKRVTT